MHETSIRDARNTLTRLVRRVEKGRPVRFTRRGKPVAVLVSAGEYGRLAEQQPRKDPWLALQKWRASLPPGFEGLSREDLAGLRDRGPDGGRPPIA